MPRRVIAAADFEAEALPAKAWTAVEITAPILSDDGAVGLPALVLRGQEAGPTLAVTAGVHGDEYEGPQACWALAAELDPSLARGTLLLLPQANPLAAAAGTRTTPERIDGLDLARLFPGDPEGQPTERLAAAIWQLVAGADLVVDLHSGGTSHDFLPVAGYYETGGPEQPLSERAARSFGLPAIWIVHEIPGVLTGELTLRGRPAVGCECRGEGRLNPDGVRAYAAGIQNTMAVLEMLDRDVREVADARTYAGGFEASPASGLFHPAVPLGSHVRAGDLIGSVADLHHRHAGAIVASRDGIVLSLRTKPTVAAGEWVATVAAERAG
jgi:predicted deacylase